MISGVLFLVVVAHQAINGISIATPDRTASLYENTEVWEAILFGYVVDAESPSYLERGDKIFSLSNVEDSISIMRDTDMGMEIDYSDSERTAAENLAVSMNVDVSYGAFSAAASMEVSRSSSSSIKTVRVDAFTKATRYEVKAIDEFLNFPERFLTDTFKEVVRSKSFEHIEDHVGVFYATKLDLGGELRKSYIMQATAEDNEQSVRAELEASYGSGLFGASVSASTEYGTRSSLNEAQVKIEWHARGGDTLLWLGAPLDRNQANIDNIKNQWSNTINDRNLHQFNYRLAYVWDLIKAVDHDKGVAYKEYLEAKWAAQKDDFQPTEFLEGPGCIRNRCIKPATLKKGEILTSENGVISLRMQYDGNLVLACNHPDKALWDSGTHGKNIRDGLKFQEDGNMVIYESPRGKAIWASGTDHSGAERLAVQNDGNVVLYNARGRPVWHTNTNRGCK